MVSEADPHATAINLHVDVDVVEVGDGYVGL